MDESRLEVFNIYYFEINQTYARNYLKVDPNAQDADGHTVLHKYVSNRMFDAEEMQKLMNRGADLELRNYTGKTAFLLAVVLRQKEMIDTFIENGADVQVQDDVGNNALHYLALPELNYDYDKVTDPRFTIKDVYEILEKLLKAGIDVNAVNKKEETPLMWAARGYDLEIVQMLLKFGASVHLQDVNGSTCLHFASTSSRDSVTLFRWNSAKHEILSTLLLNKACVNCFNLLGCTALKNIFGSRHRNKELFARELIKAATLANWKRKIVFHLTKTLILGRKGNEDFAVRYAHYCYAEVEFMKFHILPEEYNLCEFALGDVSEDELKRTPDIKDEVLSILLEVPFTLYNELILSRLGRPYLRSRVVNLRIFTKGEHNEIYLSPGSLYKLSSFLANNDIFNLLSAFSEQLGLEIKVHEMLADTTK